MQPNSLGVARYPVNGEFLMEDHKFLSRVLRLWKSSQWHGAVLWYGTAATMATEPEPVEPHSFHS